MPFPTPVGLPVVVTLNPVDGIILGLLSAVLLLAAVAGARHLAHLCRCTTPELAACLFHRFAALVLRRGNGRHRMRDKYELQRTIRADFHELSRRGLTGGYQP